MGATGSYTAKAVIPPLLFPFSKWGSKDIQQFLLRGQQELPETFGLRKHEFDFLVDADTLGFITSRTLFQEIFDTDRNGLIDKFEVMCIICMVSKVSSEEKVQFFFSLFNFNNKGYLNESELMLLILAVTRGAYKIDQKFIPPNANIVRNLVEEAFSFAKHNPQQLRRPELVKFVQNNQDVVAFLECWRGHASQVLLTGNFKWKDYSFPCAESSLVPFPAWYHEGFPPTSFIHWRRREAIGISEHCYEYLFAHTVSFIKTVDRRLVYKGEGILGRSYFQTGFLADKWLINGLSAMISRPMTLTRLFAPTGQEEQGRFCTRFYEGNGWRSVYVDDRLPCTPDNQPAFATSSCPLEVWPMILEKGFAKYLGSYAHIGRASARGDSTQSALRLLTGGHVIRYATVDFGWRSVEEEVVGIANGLTWLKKLLRAGSIIGFGRSVASALASRNSSIVANNDVQILPPFGHIFPVVGLNVQKGFVKVVLKDCWGLISDIDPEVNYDTGHTNTFQVAIEDISQIYDTMLVSHFPDSQRTEAEQLHLTPWNTEVLGNSTHGQDEPAAFLLRVTRNEVLREELSYGNTTDKRRHRKSTMAEIDAVLNQAEKDSKGKGKSGVNFADKNMFRLKDRVDLSRDKKGKQSHGLVGSHDIPKVQGSKSLKKEKSSSNIPTDGEGTGGSEQDDDAQRPASTARNKFRLKTSDELANKLCEVFITISSSCDWTFAGSLEAGAVLKARLIPANEDTKRAIAEYQQSLKEQEIRRETMSRRKTMEQEKLLKMIDEMQNTNREVTNETNNDVNNTDNLPNTAMIESNTSNRGSSANSRRSSVSNSRRNSVNNSRRGSVNNSRKNSIYALEDEHAVNFTQDTINENDLKQLVEKDTKPFVTDSLLTNSDDLNNPNQPMIVSFTLTEERSWVSTRVQLLPGEYLVFADIQFTKCTSYEEARQRSLPKEISEAPWLEEEFNYVNKTMHNSVFHPKKLAMLLNLTSNSSVHSETSIEKMENIIFPRENKLLDQSNSGDNKPEDQVESDMNAELYKQIIGNTQMGKKKNTKKQSHHQKHLLEHIVWLQTSSYDHLELSILTKPYDRYIDSAYVDDGSSLQFPQPFFPPPPPPPTDDLDIDSVNDKNNGKLRWPFLAETQSEVTSRELYNIMTRLREESELLGAEFIQLANKVKEERKRVIRRETMAKLGIPVSALSSAGRAAIEGNENTDVENIVNSSN